MVTEFLLDNVFALVTGVLSLLPDISWTVNVDMITKALEWLKVVCYILPIQTIIAILVLIVALQGFRIIISLIKTIWGILPIV